MNTLFFLIGASGAGKTSVVKILEQQKIPYLKICYFDSIGVPSNEEMIREYGSGEEWQKSKTVEWVRRIKTDYLPAKNVILDAQTRPIFIEEACRKNKVEKYKIILFDCEDGVRKRRLTKRGQPELASDTMMKWAQCLREESIEKECKIIDTSNLSIDQSLHSLRTFIEDNSEARTIK